MKGSTITCATLALLPMGLLSPYAAAAQWPSDDAQPKEFSLAINAKILCSGIWVQGRDPAVHAAADLKRFEHFGWGDDFTYTIDEDAKRLTMSAPGVPSRIVQYNGDQGCSILPRGAEDIYFEASEVGAEWPIRNWDLWPTGDRTRDEPLPPEVDVDALNTALDYAIANHEHAQNTRAVAVVYDGRLIGERYATGVPRDMPHLSWSEGKSITAALIGVLIEQGALTLDQPAPVAEWNQTQDDPRAAITIRNLLNMSSGLDFNNWGLGQDRSLSAQNHHFRIYFDGINVFDHAVSFPLEAEPGTRWEYLNSDPLTLGKIVRETVEARGEDYHAFPWTALFDKIGIKDAVLETDAWGNFIMTGFDYMSARDWARFGLLHLQNGMWGEERILPDFWSDFVSTPAPASANQGYGGLFWLNARGAYDRIPTDAYWPSGFMGQTTMIIPSKKLVIVRLGPSPGDFAPYLNKIVGDIVEAIGEPGGG
ncbi:MAG: serine hydrolase [Gemmatimonadetes bacterium]|jgi:CubicO group peptidase (beta-lactamase class C family)|nr:serine hydrolase [Gemmatimonadota bacterium]